VYRELYYFDYVSRKASDIVAIIDSRALEVFQRATDTAVDKTELFRSRLRVEFLGFEIGRDVRIELGKPRDSGYATYIPIRWHAKEQAGLFPSMDAELEITPLADEQPLAQIGLLGRYRPPAGLLGAVGDATLMHRVAEASVRHFVTDLAVRLRSA
jgi:hypothetical protein